VRSDQGELFRAPEVVLALALEQALPLLKMLPPAEEQAGVLGLLGMFTSLPCLTVIAGYSDDRAAPDWDILYPEEGREVLLVGNESSKVAPGGPVCLVVQAAPQWSWERLEQPKEQWTRELLSRAASHLGAWAAEPESIHPHRWRYARLSPADELAGPIRLLGEWGRLGLAGDLFSPGGGAQAAWHSGDLLAARILAGHES
jgi:predicted NAD/FAD-dependent oxidoreductase